MGKGRDHNMPYGYAVLSFLLFIVFIVVGECVEHGENHFLKIAGFISLLGAIIFIFPPFYLLQKHGCIEKGKAYLYTQQIVTRGLYAIVRHPQYLGYVLLVVGFMLLHQNWFSLFIGTLMILSLYMQARAEEEYLVKKFGKRYLDYAEKVPCFNFVLGLIRMLKDKLCKSSLCQ